MDDLDRLLAQQAQAQAQKPQVDQLDALLASRSVQKQPTVATKPQQLERAPQEDRGIFAPIHDITNAFGHHFMGGFHGAAQLVEHGINAGANKFLPDANAEETPTFGGSLRRIINETVASDDEAMRQREAEYQAKVPDGVVANVGAGLGMIASGGRTMPATSGLVENMGAKLASQLPNWTAKMITPASKIAGAAAAGAVAGGMSPVTSGSYWDAKEDQVKSGAALGAALKMLAPAAAKIGANVADRFGWIPKDATVDVNKVVEGATVPPAVVSKPKIVPTGQGTFKVVQQEADHAPLIKNSKTTQASQQDFEAAGLTGQNAPTAAQSLRDPGLWTAEQNMAKANTGGALNQKYVAQNQAIQDSIKKIKEGTSGTATSATAAGENASDAIIGKWNESQEKVGQLYKEIRNSEVATKAVAPSKLLDAISEHADISGADQLTGTVLRRMKKFDLIEPDSLKFDPASGWQFKLKDGAQLNVNQAEEMRKVINSTASSKTEKMVAGKLVDALDNDVIDGSGVDAFKAARDAARQRFQEFYPSGQGYQSPTVGKIIDGKIAPDNLIGNVMINGKSADVLAVKKSLLSGTPEQIQRGQAAWDDLRGQVIDHLLTNSVSKTTGKFSPAAYANELDKIGVNLKHIFTPQELSALGSIKRAGNAAFADVPFSAVNHSNTGPYIENMLKQSGMSKAGELTGKGISLIPGLGGAGEKLAEKASQAGQKGVEQNLANYNPAVMARMTKNAEVQKALQVLPMSEHVTNMLIRNRQQKDSKAQ